MARNQERIVAVGLLTADDLRILGDNFRRAYPVDEAPCFEKLLREIDDADEILKGDGAPQLK